MLRDDVGDRARASALPIVGLLAAGLAARLAALPFAATADPDAVARVMIAREWLADPHLITHGVWGPLHFYLLAAVIWLTGDPVLGPIGLNIVLSVATAGILYAFTRREFSREASLLVAAAYLFYPVAFRNSLQSLAETLFVFLAGIAVLLLPVSGGPGAWRRALAAGAFLTLAGAVRYEGWVLIPLLGLLMLKQRGPLVAFLSTALAFPLFWLAGNYLHSGDPLYSMHFSTNWQMTLEGANEGLNAGEVLRRLTFFPAALLFGLTPVVALLSVAGAIAAVREGHVTRKWLVPSLGLLAFFTVKALDGSLGTRARYGMLLAFLLLPFAGEAWNRMRPRLRHPSLWGVVLIASMLPLSYVGWAFRWTGLASLEHLLPGEIKALPRMAAGATAPRVVAALAGLPDNGRSGVLLDFWAWDETYYVALMSGIEPARLHILPGAKNATLQTRNETMTGGGLEEFLTRFDHGILVTSRRSRFLAPCDSGETRALCFVECPSIRLLTRVEAEVDDVSVSRYARDPSNPSARCH